MSSGTTLSYTQAVDSGLVYSPDESFDTHLAKNKDLKGLVDYKLNELGVCEEVWYDWFTVPNYHIGNNHEKVVDGDASGNSTCYSPCPSGTVPAYGKDPVDGDIASLFDRSDKLDMCVPLSTYFSGKYADGFSTDNEFCPISRIHRIHNAVQHGDSHVRSKYISSNLAFTLPKNIELSTPTIDIDQFNFKDNATKQRIADMYMTNELTNESKNQDTYNLSFDANIQSVVSKLASLSAYDLTNVKKPMTTVMDAACNRLNEDADRLQETYNICKEISDKQNDPHQVSLAGGDAKKLLIMKQACDLVFCSDENNAISMLGAEKICFPEARTEFEEGDGDEDTTPPIPESEQNSLMIALQNGGWIVLGMLFILFAYIFFRTVLLKVLIIIWEWIASQIWGKQWAALYLERDICVNGIRKMTELYDYDVMTGKYFLR